MYNVMRYQIIMVFYNYKHENFFLNGTPGEGECIVWGEDGEIETQQFFKNDKYDGSYKLWLDKNTLTNHFNFKDGILDGEYRKWDEKGNLIAHKWYKEGNVVANFLFNPELKEKYL